MEGILTDECNKKTILFSDDNKELLSALLNNLHVFMAHTASKKIVLLIPFETEDLKKYSKGNSFFSYKIVSLTSIKRKIIWQLITRRNRYLIVQANEYYNNNLLRLVGKNGVTIDDVVLKGILGLPEEFLE